MLFRSEVVLEVAFFFAAEGFAVGEEEFHVAGLGAIDGGVVDLVEDAVGDGEPDAAGGGVGGGDGVFSARGPTGCEAGCAKGWTLVFEPAVERDGITHWISIRTQKVRLRESGAREQAMNVAVAL